MGGVAKVFSPSNIKRGVVAGATGGLSEFTRKDPYGGVNNPLGLKTMGLFGGDINPPPLAAAPGGQSSTELLAQTGGAPVLASIAMGVSAKDALAGFMGIPGDQFDEYIKGLNPKDAYALKAVQNQLETIQSNTDLRNKAVQNVINDFPNITAKVAQARAASGQEFDEVTKGAIQQALQGTAAKYAAGGGLSSGAFNEAVAKVGQNAGFDKLNYMGERTNNAWQQEMAGFSARLGEVNALRDFQNTMLGRQGELGFSANQANLGRIQNGGQFNAGQQNQFAMNQYNQDTASQNQLFGALGSLGGSYIGGKMLAGQIAAQNQFTTVRTNPVAGYMVAGTGGYGQPAPQIKGY